MDYLDMTANERYEIDQIYAKDESERTDEEKKTIIEFETAWATWKSLQTQLDKQREKTQQITIAYHQALANEAQAEFDAKVKDILGSEFVLEDD